MLIHRSNRKIKPQERMKTRILKPVLVLAAITLIVVACDKDAKMAQADDVERGILLSNMDTTVSPKDDFYNYVNGSWMKYTKIPEDRSTWGGFSILRKSTDKDVLDIIAVAQETGSYGNKTDQAKALAIFNTKLDTVARNEAGLTPLQPALDDIAGITNLTDLQTV